MTNLFKKLSTEDAQFLVELAQKLKTQDSRATAKPLIFTIKEEIKIIGLSQDYADDCCLVDEEGQPFFTSEEVVEYVTDYIMEDPTQTIQEFAKGYDMKVDETNLESLLNLINKVGYDWTITHYHTQNRFRGEFLTEEAASEHLKANRHHYNETATIYCKRAWRNPELEELLTIVEKLAE